MTSVRSITLSNAGIVEGDSMIVMTRDAAHEVQVKDGNSLTAIKVDTGRTPSTKVMITDSAWRIALYGGDLRA